MTLIRSKSSEMMDNLIRTYLYTTNGHGATRFNNAWKKLETYIIGLEVKNDKLQKIIKESLKELK